MEISSCQFSKRFHFPKEDENNNTLLLKKSTPEKISFKIHHFQPDNVRTKIMAFETVKAFWELLPKNE